MDKLTPVERSRNMSRIRSKGTGPERAVRSLLHRLGFRFRLNRRDLPGSPDIVLPKYRTVIFVHGCFWHRHEGCKDATEPKTNTLFWQQKFKKNVLRDATAAKQLGALGWNVITVWECETQQPVALEERLTHAIQAGHHNK